MPMVSLNFCKLRPLDTTLLLQLYYCNPLFINSLRLLFSSISLLPVTKFDQYPNCCLAKGSSLLLKNTKQKSVSTQSTNCIEQCLLRLKVYRSHLGILTPCIFRFSTCGVLGFCISNKPPVDDNAAGLYSKRSDHEFLLWIQSLWLTPDVL